MTDKKVFKMLCTLLRQCITSVTSAVNSNPAPSRHTKWSTYCCFLPDLAGFIGFCCARPSYQRHLLKAGLTMQASEREFHLAVADCKFRAPLPPRVAQHKNNNIIKNLCQCNNLVTKASMGILLLLSNGRGTHLHGK